MQTKLDAIVFGATGFTGKIVVEKAVEILKEFQWGIAGRNEQKLRDVLHEIGREVGQDLSHIPIIVADVEDKQSIEAMARKCKIVLNCCGPYRFYGEVVVKACLEAGTHHVDISGEPQYIDKMQLLYDDLAKEKGCYAVSTCAFESVPAEMAVRYVERNFAGVVNSIELYWENDIEYRDPNSKALLNSGTWESAVYAMAYWREIYALQRKLNGGFTPKLTPKLWIKPFVHTQPFSKSYFIPFPGTDRATVQRSERLLYKFEHKRPIQFEVYLGLKSLFWSLLLPFYVLFLAILAQVKWTREYLLRNPHVFSAGLMTHQGPTEANRKSLSFSMTLKATGWSKGQELQEKPNKSLVARVSGSDPCYGLTSIILLCTAKTILKDHDKMPGRGGVLTPGAAFAHTSLIEELSQARNGLKFEIL